MIIADEIAKMEKKQALEELEKVADEIIYSIEDCTISKLLAMEEHIKPVYSMEVRMVDNLPMRSKNLNSLLWTVQAISMHDINYMMGMFARLLKGLLGLHPFIKYVVISKIDTGEMIATFTVKELLTLEDH